MIAPNIPLLFASWMTVILLLVIDTAACRPGRRCTICRRIGKRT